MGSVVLQYGHCSSDTALGAGWAGAGRAERTRSVQAGVQTGVRGARERALQAAGRAGAGCSGRAGMRSRQARRVLGVRAC